MKKFFLNPLFATFFTLLMAVLYYTICYVFRFKYGIFDIEEIGASEALTYLFYGFAAGVVLCLYKDYWHTPRQTTFFALCFLWLAALLREMGIQHWLTQHDSTAIKIRFFTNPNNPFYEKVISALVILTVVGVILYLTIKHFKQNFIEFIHFKTIPWTIAAFAGLGFITQIADRFPANYAKATGEHLGEPIRFALKILEEGGESVLPLLFAIGLLQYHFILRKKICQNDDVSTSIAQDTPESKTNKYY